MGEWWAESSQYTEGRTACHTEGTALAKAKAGIVGSLTTWNGGSLGRSGEKWGRLERDWKIVLRRCTGAVAIWVVQGFVANLRQYLDWLH